MALTPEQFDQLRRDLDSARNLNGWCRYALVDGRDEATGMLISWQEYRHLDGRRAVVNGQGCSDPELRELLKRSHAEEEAVMRRWYPRRPARWITLPWWLSPLDVARWLIRLLARINGFIKSSR